jgi:hypothetical protein
MSGRRSEVRALCAALKPHVLRVWKALRVYWRGLEVSRSRGKGEVTARIFSTGVHRFSIPVSEALLGLLVARFATPHTACVVDRKDGVTVFYDDFIRECLK